MQGPIERIAAALAEGCDGRSSASGDAKALHRKYIEVREADPALSFSECRHRAFVWFIRDTLWQRDSRQTAAEIAAEFGPQIAHAHEIDRLKSACRAAQRELLAYNPDPDESDSGLYDAMSQLADVLGTEIDGDMPSSIAAISEIVAEFAPKIARADEAQHTNGLPLAVNLRLDCDWCKPCLECRNLMRAAADEIDRLRDCLTEIESLASWHADPAADPADESPVDMTAHVNGLIVQICQRR